MQQSRSLVSLALFLAAAGFCRVSAAANICNETVAATRTVDGIPSYAQCTASQSSAIYSDNGVDTATASGGTGWVRTQYSGGYQCTELAHRYVYFKWNVQNVPNGNAGTWCDGTIPSGLVKTTTPMHGDLIVFAPGSCGADATTGHVAVVDVVNASSTVTFVEQNSPGRRSCAISTAACFLHATANTGTSVDGGAPDAEAPDTGGAAGDDASPRPDLSLDGRRSFDSPGAGGTTGTGGVVGTGGTAGAGGVGGRGMTGTGGAIGAGGSSGTAGALASGGQIGEGGAPSSGGRIASGGAAGLGGSIGAGGAVASGGLSGTGGASPSVADTGGSSGTTASSTPSNNASSGCACRLADGQGKRAGWTYLVALVLVIGLLAPRRRRPRI